LAPTLEPPEHPDSLIDLCFQPRGGMAFLGVKRKLSRNLVQNQRMVELDGLGGRRRFVALAGDEQSRGGNIVGVGEWTAFGKDAIVGPGIAACVE
jgi:hypothetical protein